MTVENLRAGDLTIDVEQRADAIVCVWRGRSNDRQPSQLLGPYFDQLLAAAKQDSLALEMQFQHLEHFNSSTITTLIRLIQDARAHRLKLVLVYDQNLKWQRLSFDALRVFDKADQLFQLRTA